ncbi:MAG: hypothetical protein ACXVB9_02080 [Bdellovibrionota bacterium]
MLLNSKDWLRGALMVLAVVSAAPSAHAAAIDQAKRIHDRLVGVPPSDAVLQQMVADITAGGAKNAALLAMDNDYFYDVMLPNWFSTWTNVALDPHVDLNDYSATAIGLIRDDLSFDQVLYGDIIYTGADNLVSTLNADGTVATKRLISPYLNTSNQHYIDLQNVLMNPADPTDLTSAARNSRIHLKTYLVKKVQSAVTGIPDTAGVLTTRAAGLAYITAGTNRREARFAFKNFLCMDMAQLSDTSRPDFRVRRDVDRMPGGDSRTFKQTCVGCHAGMDAMSGAFAYFDFPTNQMVYTAAKVQAKYNKNNTVFPGGYITTDDSFLNLWIAGANADLGWNGNSSGNGARQFGKMISQSDQFATCMVTRVFNRVCLRDPASSEQAQIQALASAFAASGRYSMKDLFASVAALPQCMGE